MTKKGKKQSQKKTSHMLLKRNSGARDIKKRSHLREEEKGAGTSMKDKRDGRNETKPRVLNWRSSQFLLQELNS